MERLDDEMSMDTLEDWDSMALVGLILELEHEFGVSIAPKVAMELTNVARIRAFLLEQGVQ